MTYEMIELSHLRNQLASGRFNEIDKKLMNKVKQSILKLDTPFKEIALNAISNCEEDINRYNFKLATQEIQLIHNFPFEMPQTWNADYFYSIELLSYIEQINDVQRIKKLIYSLAKLQDKLPILFK